MIVQTENTSVLLSGAHKTVGRLGLQNDTDPTRKLIGGFGHELERDDPDKLTKVRLFDPHVLAHEITTFLRHADYKLQVASSEAET